MILGNFKQLNINGKLSLLKSDIKRIDLILNDNKQLSLFKEKLISLINMFELSPEEINSIKILITEAISELNTETLS